jgi:hypothetical protein
MLATIFFSLLADIPFTISRGNMSDSIKMYFRLLISIILLIRCSALLVAADVSLAWDPSPSENISEYKIYIGNSSGVYNTSVTTGIQTSYKIVNLGVGTWYFAVSAFDAIGNESDVSNEVSKTIALSVPDTTPPTISNIASSSISDSGADISWNTSEAADSQVEYGTTTSYGNFSIPLKSTVSWHSQRIVGLTAITSYHYRVRSRDAAGNLVISGDFEFTTGSTNSALVISSIEVSNITSRSALVSWATNKPADSRIEYWTSENAVRASAISLLSTQHSIALNDLKKNTLYVFTIKSSDADGSPSTSAALAFTTQADGNWVAVLPRFTDGQDQIEPGSEIAIGIALTNSGNDNAEVALTEIAENGYLIGGQGIINPGTLNLSPQNQLAKLDVEIFGFELDHLAKKGWIKLESTNHDVGGFYLAFDSNLSFMDGTNLGEYSATNLVHPEIESTGSNKVDIVNPNPDAAQVRVDLVTADGAVRGSQTRIIEANGSLVADFYEDLFAGVQPAASDYFRISATKGVHSFQLMRKGAGDISSLAGQDSSEGGTTLYSPQYVQGGTWQTTLSIINLDAREGTIELRLINDDGVQIGETKTVLIPANGKLFIDNLEFFGILDLEQITCGYVKAVSDGVRLVGSTAFGDRTGKSLSSALPLIYSPTKSVIFSHIASNDLYYTGLAMVNPGETGANVTIELYEANGTPIAAHSLYLPPGQRKTQLLTELFPSLEGQDHTSGSIHIISDMPLASIALFGTRDILSAIPPRTIQ